VKESQGVIADLKQQIDALDKERADAILAVGNRWGQAATDVSVIKIAPLKKDVLVELFGVAWMPYHVVKTGDETIELPGFGI
jgi:hypothetical protein